MLYIKKNTSILITLVFLVGAGGFEPPKLKAADLQSVPIGHSGTRPYSFMRPAAADCLIIIPSEADFVNTLFQNFSKKFGWPGASPW